MPKQITTARTVLRKMKRGARMVMHPWSGGYQLWDENGGRYAIPVADGAAKEAIRSKSVELSPGRPSAFHWTWRSE
jgi:hypothetical protein